ncbi:MAG TPA: hypothetical protein VMD79_01870 [Solirubrobacteraceae bacterium]|nr:hypothetical protein [Solirubrobacteraceae bacterium]
MKILAIGKLTGPDVTPHVPEEQRVVAQWREDGFILDSFLRRDRSGAILLLEDTDAAAAEQRLGKLPFVERDLIEFELVELAG